MDEQSERAKLDEQVKKIFYEELEKSGIRYDFAQVRVSDTRTVGVQGDERTYGYVAEIEIYKGDKFVWQPEFLARLSNSITNNVRGVNRVDYVIGKKD